MIRVKHRSLLIILVSLLLVIILLVISCDLNSMSKFGGTPRVKKAHGIARPRNHMKKDVKFKLKELLSKFGLLNKQLQAIDKIKRIVTDPNIGDTESYKTYSELQFYNLLETLGDVKVKEIIKNYLQACKIQFDAQRTFKKAIKNIADSDLKKQLQTKLNNYNSSYALQLKSLFNYDNDDVIYGNVINDYIIRTTTQVTEQMDELASLGVVLDIGDAKSIYLQLDSGERNIIDHIKEIVTNPNIGDPKDYETYTKQEFDDLVIRLGLLDIKEIIKNHLEVDVLQKDFDKSIGFVLNSNLKVELYRRLNNYKIDYMLGMKKLFNEVVSGKISYDDYVTQTIAQAHNYSTILKTEITDTTDNKDFYSLFDSEEQNIIEEIRNIVTKRSFVVPSSDYKLRTEEEFNDLLFALGVVRVKEIIRVYSKYKVFKESKYVEIGKSIKGITDFNSKLILQIKLANARGSYEFQIKKAFTKFDDNDNILDDLPDPDYVYDNVIHAVYTVIFNSIKDEVAKIVNYEKIKSKFLKVYMQTLAYIQEHAEQSDFNMQLMLGSLDNNKVKGIVEIHFRIIKAKEAATAALNAAVALNNVNDVREKAGLQSRFDECVAAYHKHLKLCFLHGDPYAFYDEIMSCTYDKDFAWIENKALSLVGAKQPVRSRY
ncbi:hypothetical protein bcCo53_001244 (plasmid) [Borrelia coriaceae]|uniref:Uncharacterized protein n=1 Tax=Borrelia coriaceae ATCC 43381 TaxID=1408429 RepID=W5T1Q1_9SPIR|nr:hypothetical protein [Borrelia coriaceae]AHH11196.1 Hypothetical protein BCO_0004404 [Borrelia coriaceae ATCC 43381]UPA17075.1 hypothetical protein bcCo53_001244 [Borrelia coriaceae]